MEYDENDVNPLFTGKRGTERVAADRAIEMKGPKITVGARTVDLSPSGFRARLSPQALSKLGGGRDAGKLMAAVHRHFASGLDVRFVESGVSIKAHVVRLAFEPGPTTEVHIACRFSADLATSDWKKIEPKDKS